MRYWIILFTAYFAMLSVAPNFQGAQLLNFSALIDHYHSDSKQSHIDFISFLVEHYADSSLPNDEKHETLPFKSVNGYGVSVLIFLPHSEALPKLNGAIAKTDSADCFSYVNSYRMQDFSAIFHPPKLSLALI
jgi:hypothetical protein